MLFKRGYVPACGFCAATGLLCCAHQGGCWNQPNHVPDDFDPKRDMQARIGLMIVAVRIENEEYGPLEPDELS
jgi:hypothetical protein